MVLWFLGLEVLYDFNCFLKTCKTKITFLTIFNYSRNYMHIAMNVNYIQ